MRSSLNVVLTSLCAALYAVGAYTTAYIPSPWGFGQFRPAVIIPSVFAIVFGPWVGGIGAAIGTLICDSIKHGTLYMGSLMAAVPGNFIGFLILGYIMRKKFTWGRFILASNLTLIIGNLTVAFLYIFLYKVLYTQALQMPVDSLIMLSFGLTLYWFITMLPFALTITPVLIRAVAAAFPGIVSEDIRIHSLKKEFPRATFSLALAAPGILILSAGIVIAYAPFGGYLAMNFPKTFTPAVMELLKVLFYICGAVLLILGFIFLGAKSFRSGKGANNS
ncbi:MAG: ECF transporter S component [Candidatus Bathyarchaeia archaeon]